jgi:hypothetical protein
MRFCGCDTSVSSGSWYGCSAIVLVGNTADVQREGRRRPEPGRLYAALQANSFAADDATSSVIRCMHSRWGVECSGDVVAEGENRWALVYSDIKRCRTRNSGYEHQLQINRGGATVRLYDGAAVIVYMCSVVNDKYWEGNSGEAMLCRPCRLRCWALVLSDVLTASLIGAGSTRRDASQARPDTTVLTTTRG